MKSCFEILKRLSSSILFILAFYCSLNGQSMTTTMEKNSKPSSSEKIVEIRTYNLKENSRDTFHRLFEERAMPMLKKWGIEVIAYGPSLHDKNTYTLIRKYNSIDHMQKSEDAFYGSDEWKNGPREAILALIENYTTLVISGDDELLDQLRKSLHH